MNAVVIDLQPLHRRLHMVTGGMAMHMCKPSIPRATVDAWLTDLDIVRGILLSISRANREDDRVIRSDRSE
jgi:hypothetical protein